LAVAFGGAGIIAVVVATTSIISQLSHILPIVGGYREPEKFVALLALTYAMFTGAGVMAIVKKLDQHEGQLSAAALGGLLVLPFVITPTIICGANGKLRPRDYPADWFAADSQLRNDPKAKKVLFLPWHQYINFGFSDRIIANPAPKFLGVSTVAG